MRGSDKGRDSVSLKSERANSSVQRTLAVVSEADLPALVVEPPTGKIRAVNELFEEEFGWSAERLRGKPYRDLVREERHREIRDLVSILSFGGSCPPVRLVLEDGDGEPRPTTWVGIPNILGEPVDPIVLVTRPTGGPVGKPVGPPSSLVEDDDELDRIPPRRSARDERGNAEKSRSLWKRWER